MACFHWIPCLLARNDGSGGSRLLRELIQVQPWQLVSSRPRAIVRERNLRQTKQAAEVAADLGPRSPLAGGGARRFCARRCVASAPPSQASQPVGWLSECSILNGSLCAPQELAQRSPSGNAAQRCLLWIQAQTGLGPSLWALGPFGAPLALRVWEPAGS